MLVISAILSVGLIASIYFSWRIGKLPTLVSSMIAISGVALGAICFAYPVSLHAILIIPAIFIWKWYRFSSGALLRYMIVTAAVVYALPTLLVLEYVGEMHSLQEEYAFESMDDRLPVPKRHAGPTMSVETMEQLKQLNQKIDPYSGGFRTRMLQRLHQSSVQHFIDSPGFGVARRIRPSDASLAGGSGRLTDHVPQPGPTSPSTFAESDRTESSDLTLHYMREMHLNSIVDFVNPQGFGLIISRQKVAGFLPHQFDSVPEAKHWKVQTLDLLGLLMHEDPVVYLSNELPNMAKLRRAPTRSLNAFETAGLQHLQQGDDLFVREKNDNIRMLGAVRSIDECVKCHGGERGDLLGAFSYALQRMP